MARYSERWSYVESAWNPDDDICLHRVDIARFEESGHEQCRRPCIQFFFIVAMVVKVVDTIDQCRSWTDQCLSRSQLSMDVEGVDLCRSGPISIIQIGLDSDVLLFDIITLGQDAFSRGGLKDLLESERVCKVIYDGRADADALYHRHGVTLRRAFDLQVLHALRYSQTNDKYVKGLQRCLDDAGVVPLLERQRAAQIKKAGKQLFAPELGGRAEVWMERPLRQLLVEYAALDVKYLVEIKRLWSDTAASAVFRVTAARLQGAMLAPLPAKGQHMSVRDFSLGPAAQFLGKPAVSAPRCFQCGGEGHLSRNCPSRHTDDEFDDFDVCDASD
ncbi:unnamed protein product [Effrenium voratum]|nr:unnamed protein product [Effrenium voratum]